MTTPTEDALMRAREVLDRMNSARMPSSMLPADYWVTFVARAIDAAVEAQRQADAEVARAVGNYGSVGSVDFHLGRVAAANDAADAILARGT